MTHWTFPSYFILMPLLIICPGPSNHAAHSLSHLRFFSLFFDSIFLLIYSSERISAPIKSSKQEPAWLNSIQIIRTKSCALEITVIRMTKREMLGRTCETNNGEKNLGTFKAYTCWIWYSVYRGFDQFHCTDINTWWRTSNKSYLKKEHLEWRKAKNKWKSQSNNGNPYLPLACTLNTPYLKVIWHDLYIQCFN